MDSSSNLKKISGLLFIATAIALVVHFVGLDVFNKRVNEVHGNDSSSASYMEIDARKDSTSTWVKRDYDLFGTKVDITGATIDGELHNTSSDTISNWTLKINIKGDCLINQAWNGEVEIHQFVGTADETVQRMNLQNYNLDDVKLKHLYDGDLLIPLQAGDYVIYYPNERFKEMPLPGNDSTKIGVIFYYRDSIDLSDYNLEFQYHRAFTQGPAFLVFAFLLAAFVLSALMYITSAIAYKRAQNEMELRKSGISSLSDMYAAIYLIDLVSGEMTPITVDEKTERLHPWSVGAKAFFDMIAKDADNAYEDVVSEFADISTLAERLSGRGSVACEFISKTYGWSSMRFFAMDRIEGQPLEKVICTVQDINQEKSEQDRIEERIARAESETEAKNVFLASISQETQAPIREILDLSERIIAEGGEEHIKSYASEIGGLGNDLLMFVDGILDYSELEAGRIQLTPVDYSLKEAVFDIAGRVRHLLKIRNSTFDLEVSETLPDGLRGDVARLKQTIGTIIAIEAGTIDSGSVKLSIFGRAQEDRVHLLVSVSASGAQAHDGTGAGSDAQQTQSSEELTDAGVGKSLAEGLLVLMGSELKFVQSDDSWHECYFEVEQEVVDATPVGSIALPAPMGKEA